MANNGTLFISDLDGTLLGSDGAISDYSRANLIRLLNNGLCFTVASARSYSSISTILAGVPIKLPVIEFNGAYITDYKTGHHYVTNSIDPLIIEKILKVSSMRNLPPFISGHNGSKDVLYYEKISNDGMDWYLKDRIKVKDSRLTRVDNIYDSLKAEIVCLNIIGSENELNELIAEFQANGIDNIEMQFQENPYSPGWHWLTIHDKKATKDKAIRRILTEEGFSPDQLSVFGDNTNDIGMFKLAFKAIAVANAFPQAKKHADKIIGSNDEDSVIKYLLKEYNYVRPDY